MGLPGGRAIGGVGVGVTWAEGEAMGTGVEAEVALQGSVERSLQP